jgi:uncharacterized secreted protein with C-terminal beta-propeller domain
MSYLKNIINNLKNSNKVVTVTVKKGQSVGPSCSNYNIISKKDLDKALEFLKLDTNYLNAASFNGKIYIIKKNAPKNITIETGFNIK